MKLLGIECSGKTASVALCDGDKLLAESFLNCGLTHSQTLLPMAEAILVQSGIALGQLDGIAVSCGPGSFTGVRIGVALAKGLAMGANLTCFGVSSLEALAWNAAGYVDFESQLLICPVMDARRSQLYNALFEWREGQMHRLCSDRAVSIHDLAQELHRTGRRVLLLGDGAELSCAGLAEADVILAPQPERFGSAWGVIRAAATAQPMTADQLLPFYLRPSQAEREYAERHQKDKPILK